jgi:hypothetical protein
MPRLSDVDIYEIRQFFEEALNQAQRTDKRQKMRMRRRIRTRFLICSPGKNPRTPGL